MKIGPVGAELFLSDRHDEVNPYPANVENMVSS